jgi:Asp-tRNA(Asn)/Glu-tRNA(Gln) amidotransferase A subunit family amidase
MAHACGMVSDLSAGADGSYRLGCRLDTKCHRRAGSALDDLCRGTGQFVLTSLDRDFKNAKLAWSSWMRSCYFITVTGLSDTSVPCGFTQQGLPVGIQIVGRHNDDLGVLQPAYAFEKETPVWKHRPAVVAS